MKITATDFAALSAAVTPLDTESARESYRTRRIPRGASVKDIDKRYRWDLFWAARGHELLSSEYADSHIDTALRRIVPAL